MASLRSVADSCLDKSGTLSVRQDIMGVYGSDNPQNRSVLAQLDRIQNQPFVRIALVRVMPSGSTPAVWPNLQLDLDNVNTVWQNECDAWVYPVNSQVLTSNLLGGNGLLDQNDCAANGHSVSTEEDALFDLGRNLGADVVGYFIAGTSSGSPVARRTRRGGAGSGSGTGRAPGPSATSSPTSSATTPTHGTTPRWPTTTRTT